MDEQKNPRDLPYKDLGASALAREKAWYLARPNVICSKAAGIGLKA